MRATILAVAAGASLALTVGCGRRETPKGEAPPPVASTRPGACAQGGGTVEDPVAGKFFPRVAGKYCVDPHGDVRTYGENARGTVDAVCTELLDGECEVYKRHGLGRVVVVRYVDGAGSPGQVTVTLSRFATRDGAYAFFTQRVVGDSDPSEASTRPLEAAGQAAVGAGVAYLWRGEHVAELAYTNDDEAPEQLKQSSEAVVPGLARALGEALPGEPAPPAAVSGLPAAGRLGVRYESKDALGVRGLGAGAVGFHREGDKRWRTFLVVAADEEGAKDAFAALSRTRGARKLEGKPYEGLRFTTGGDEGAPRVEWVAKRVGARLLGVGDEPFAAEESQRLGEAARIERLDAW